MASWLNENVMILLELYYGVKSKLNPAYFFECIKNAEDERIALIYLTTHISLKTNDNSKDC